MYIPTCEIFDLLDAAKNTKSPASRSDLLTDVPTVYCWAAVLGNCIPRALLNT